MTAKRILTGVTVTVLTVMGFTACGNAVDHELKKHDAQIVDTKALKQAMKWAAQCGGFVEIDLKNDGTEAGEAEVLVNGCDQ